MTETITPSMLDESELAGYLAGRRADPPAGADAATLRHCVWIVRGWCVPQPPEDIPAEVARWLAPVERAMGKPGAGRPPAGSAEAVNGTTGTGISPERILAIARSVDGWLDAEDGEQYQSQPLARTWARVAKVSNEANEALEALSCATGQNPRKGTCGTEDDVLGELADTILTAFVAIRHITRDDARTWSVVTAGFEKAAARAATAMHMARWLEGGDAHPGEAEADSERLTP